MKSPSLSHNSSQTDTFHKILTFWQALGLKTRQNPNSDHIEYFLSYPSKEIVGRIFGFGDWFGIQFYIDFHTISAKFKGDEPPPDAPTWMLLQGFAGILAVSLDIPEAQVLVRSDGFFVYKPCENSGVAGKGGQANDHL